MWFLLFLSMMTNKTNGNAVTLQCAMYNAQFVMHNA